MDGFSKVEESVVRDVRVVAFEGELDLDTAPRLCVHLDAARMNGVSGVLLDLTDVSFCDSQGLSAILGEDREMRVARKKFALVAPEDSEVRRLFELCGVVEV